MASDNPLGALSPDLPDDVKAAMIEKLHAEAEHARIESELATSKAAVELRKLEAEVAKTEADRGYQVAMAEFATTQTRMGIAQATVQEIAAGQAEQAEKERLTANKYNFVYTFDGEVSGTSVKACIDQLTKWERLHPKVGIEIVFNSPGGSVLDGMALFDFIQSLRHKGHKITTVAYGYAASMAGILLQAGDVRIIGRESYILIHEISFGTMGKIGEVEDEVAFINKIQNRVLDIFAARCKLTKRQLKHKWQRKDWWLDSSEAIRDGFVDKVR